LTKESVSVPGETEQPGAESFQFFRYILHRWKSRGGKWPQPWLDVYRSAMDGERCNWI